MGFCEFEKPSNKKFEFNRISIVSGKKIISFELIDNTGLRPLFKTDVLLSFFDTNTRNHEFIYLIWSDFGGVGPWCQGFFYFNRTIMIGFYKSILNFVLRMYPERN